MKTFLVALLFQFSRILGNLLAGCLPVILIGCASSGVVMNVSPVSTGLSISHDFVVVGTSSALGDVEPQKSLLNALIISGLQQTQKFGRVSGNQIAISPTSGSGIKVNADIKEVYAVSNTARVMVGAFAGQARILVQVTVSDLKSGKQIETFEAEGTRGWRLETDAADVEIFLEAIELEEVGEFEGAPIFRRSARISFWR
jgi:hypothetical protein